MNYPATILAASLATRSTTRSNPFHHSNTATVTKMVLAHHSIFSFYGFWLPNDPRGSGSDYIAVWELFRYGPATKVTTRRSVASRRVDPTWKARASTALDWPPLVISGVQALAVVDGFREAIAEAGYAIHACAILPDHVHLVIGRHARGIRQIVGHLRAKATRKLRERGLLESALASASERASESASQATRLKDRPVWGAHGWNVALDSCQAVARAIGYVELNPEKEGKKRQHWDIVTPFDEALARRVKHAGIKRRIGGAALRRRQERLEREERAVREQSEERARRERRG
jgi:REP element-mobilizing transposase RayT